MKTVLKTPESIPEPKYKAIEGFQLRFDLQPNQINSLKSELMVKSKVILDEISTLKPAECNYQSVFKPLSDLESWRGLWGSVIDFPQYVSTDSEIREASAKATVEFQANGIENHMREDVYLATQNAVKNFNITELTEEEDRRFVEKIQLDYRRAGLHLPQDKRTKLTEMFTKLSELCNTFNRNIGDDITTLQFTRDQLRGLPDDFINALEVKDSKHVLTMKYPDV